MTTRSTRRDLLKAGLFTATVGTFAITPPNARSASTADPSQAADPFSHCLNTGTIRGFNLPIDKQVDVAAEAGYTGIEPWIRDIQQYAEAGHSLADLKKRIADLGVTVESAIGFAPWIVDEDNARAQGVEQLKRDMELVAQIGGTRIAAPPSGATRERITDLDAVAERYGTILDVGRSIGVQPLLEVWGPSATLSRLGEAAYVVAQCGREDASLLLDTYHLYKGGNSFAGLTQLSGAAMRVFHINDYPDQPPRETIGDADRVFPGDGVCPLDFVFRTLFATGFRGALSLELFNRAYWETFPTAIACAKAGLEKTKAAVRRALADA